MKDGTLANLPWLQGMPDPITSMTWHAWVEVNSKLAEDMGIKEGDMLEISSPAGSVEAPAYVHPAVPPWTVSMPVGQGHTNYGEYASGIGVNLMNVIAPIVDVDTRALAWAGTRVKIRNTGVNIDIPKFEGSVPSIEAEEGHIIQVTNLH
jgi:molybdopterin-containing oxidoreductase family iron-sulfur binding subunit